MGVMEGKQKLPAAGVKIQKGVVPAQGTADDGFVVPGQVLFFLVSSVDVGKVPPVDLGSVFFLLPKGFPMGLIHDSAPFKMWRWDVF